MYSLWIHQAYKNKEADHVQKKWGFYLIKQTERLSIP